MVIRTLKAVSLSTVAAIGFVVSVTMHQIEGTAREKWRAPHKPKNG